MLLVNSFIVDHEEEVNDISTGYDDAMMSITLCLQEYSSTNDFYMLAMGICAS